MSQMELMALLRPWLGSELLAKCDICDLLSDLLAAFDLTSGDIDELYRRLSGCLFAMVRSATRADMRVRLDDGRFMRVRVDDIDQMADEAMYLRLRQLAHNVSQYHRLREYAMTHDSLSALRALYVNFAAFQSEDERALIAHTIRTCHMPYRWQGWLKETSI